MSGAGVFYAGSTDVRAAKSVEAVSNISVGEFVCRYGRSSNVRHWGPDVDSVSVTCTFSPFPYATERLVGTDNDVGIGGDSGGGRHRGLRRHGGRRRASGAPPPSKVLAPSSRNSPSARSLHVTAWTKRPRRRWM
ncbi:hypothetical protein ACWEPL_52885 [Nonomuraea sp. NPDC004186]